MYPILKRYFTRPEQPAGIKLQERDYHLLALLDDYRFLDSYLLWKLSQSKYPSFGWDSFKHRLTNLWRNGYLNRPETQVILMAKSNNFHLVYCLTKKGAEMVAARLGRDFQKTTWKVDQDRASYRMLEHQLSISKFRATIHLAKGLEIGFWLGDRQFRRQIRFRATTSWQQNLLRSSYPYEQVSLNCEPDSFFLLKAKGQSQAYALEIDRGTASQRAMGRKFLAYFKLFQQLKDNPLFFNNERISHFRVLTVTPDQSHFERPETRIGHLIDLVKTIDDRPGQGYRAFWFTSEDKFSFREPESILQRIWQTPKEGERLSLLD